MIQEENLHKDKDKENDLPVSLERIREANTTMSLFGLGRQLVSQCKCAASYNRGRPRCYCVKLVERIVAKDPGVCGESAACQLRKCGVCGKIIIEADASSLQLRGRPCTIGSRAVSFQIWYFKGATRNPQRSRGALRGRGWRKGSRSSRQGRRQAAPAA